MKIYDTLSGRKQEFAPAQEPVRLYVCGVTPYAPAHVGHAMSSIVFDVVRRYLEYRGFHVRHVQNFTDIDDKLIERAVRDEEEVSTLAAGHIEGFFRDMDALNILRAHVYPRATHEIPRMIEIMARLFEKGFAYQAGGDVYFRVSRAQGYGKLSHRTLKGMRAGARVEMSESKEHPMDFALWKGAKPGEPRWDSPWGAGRPGWHIECTAMALGYLGETVDIHGGGQDLIFPHHENEIAQSEAYTGHAPFVRFWMHNGLLQMDQQKMSKSLGNLVTVQDALARHPSAALRLSVLGSHYRSPATYSEEGVAAAQRGMDRLRQAAVLAGPAVGEGELDSSAHRDRFLAAMDDDFNTPQALAALFDLARDVNRAAEGGVRVAGAQQTLLELGREVLGLTFEREEAGVPPGLREQVEEMVERRARLRAARDFAGADGLRQELAQLGVVLTDMPGGTTWRWEGQG